MLRPMEYPLLGLTQRQALCQQCLWCLIAAAPAADPTTAAVSPGAGVLQQGITPQWEACPPLSDLELHHSDERTQHLPVAQQPSTRTTPVIRKMQEK